MHGIERIFSLSAAVRRSVAHNPESCALRLDNAERTYRDLWSGAETKARQLQALGITTGDRIGILLPNSPDYLELVIAAGILGVAAVPINMRYKSRELRHLVVDSGLRVLFTCQCVDEVVDFDSLLREAFPELDGAVDARNLVLADAPKLTTIIGVGTASPIMVALDEIVAGAGELPPEPEPEAALLLMYTSGTTANPKGCIVSHRAFLSNAWSIIEGFALTEEDIWWCPLPMFHIGGLLFVVTMLTVGGGYCGMAHFDPARAIVSLKEMPPTIFYPLFPTITLPLIRHPQFGEVDRSGIRIICNLAPTDVQRIIHAAVPDAALVGAFGMTETCGTVCYGLPGDPEALRLSSCGRPLPGWSVRIVDSQTFAPCAPGERGEIAVKGAGLFSGYWNEPELTARQHLPDGYFLTGDVGSLDADGFLTFHGRYKDQLKVGGENVAALEVESFLATHPAVSLAQVVGVPDAKYGEVPAAFIELKHGADATENEIVAFCQGKIARFKIPRYVRFVDEWPMSATKVLKYKLRDALEQELSAN